MIRLLIIALFTVPLFNPICSAVLPPAEIRQLLNSTYIPGVNVVSKEIQEESDECIVYTVTLNGFDPGDQMFKPFHVYEYWPTSLRIREALIIHPPTSGTTTLNLWLAENACERGFHTFVVEQHIDPDFPRIDAGIHDRDSLRVMSVMRQILEYSARPEAFCYGESLGGIVCSGIIGLDTRFSGGVVVVGGAPFHRILAHSDLDRLQILKDKRRPWWGFNTDDEYEDMLKKSMKIEFEDLARTEVRDRLWFFLSSEDTTVMTPTQEELYSKWGSPKAEWFALGHVASVAYMKTYQDDVLEFLVNLSQPWLTRRPAAE